MPRKKKNDAAEEIAELPDLLEEEIDDEDYERHIISLDDPDEFDDGF